MQIGQTNIFIGEQSWKDDDNDYDPLIVSFHVVRHVVYFDPAHED